MKDVSKKWIEGILDDYKNGKATKAEALQGLQNAIGEAIEMGAEKGKEYEIDEEVVL